MDTLISVVIPCYNSEATIDYTLGSLEKNDHSRFEVVIVDDGSTDNSLTVIDRFKQKSDMDIRVITQPNGGVSVARNKGIQESKGEYILLLDADDMFADGFIDAVVSILEEAPVDTVMCYKTEDVLELSNLTGIIPAHKNVSPVSLMEQYTYYRKEIGMTSFLFRKSIIDQYGIQFTPGSRYGEDWEFATMYLAHCQTAVEMDCNYFYRVHSSSVTFDVTYAQTDAISAAERTSDYLKALHHPFAERFTQFMIPRAIFSVAHRFAKADNKDLYDRLIHEYDVAGAMKAVASDSAGSVAVRLAAASYRISPKLYFKVAKER